MAGKCPRCGYTEAPGTPEDEAREQKLDEKIMAMTRECETLQARLRDAAQAAMRGLERI